MGPNNALYLYEGNEGPWVYFLTAGAAAGHRVQRPALLGGRTWSADPRGTRDRGAPPGGR
jgi:hypothetical protein